MALASGTKLGPYEIQSPLGAGSSSSEHQATGALPQPADNASSARPPLSRTDTRKPGTACSQMKRRSV